MERSSESGTCRDRLRGLSRSIFIYIFILLTLLLKVKIKKKRRDNVYPNKFVPFYDG